MDRGSQVIAKDPLSWLSKAVTPRRLFPPLLRYISTAEDLFNLEYISQRVVVRVIHKNVSPHELRSLALQE